MRVVPTHLRDALSARIPSADFTPYLAFIESLPQVDEGHRHHILPQKEFSEFAKDPSNIIRLTPADHFRAHYWLAVCAPNCGSLQVAFYIMAGGKFLTRINKEELPRYADVYGQAKAKYTETARENGRKSADRLRSYLTHEHQVRAGRKNVESGQIFGIATLESCAKGGREGGRRTAEITGNLASIRTFESSARGGRRGGRTQGRKNAESGLLRRIASVGGHKSTANHVRWHVKRGLVSPDCLSCNGKLRA